MERSLPRFRQSLGYPSSHFLRFVEDCVKQNELNQRERERETERQRQTDRQTDRQRPGETETDRQKIETEDRQTDRRHRETKRQTETETAIKKNHKCLDGMFH